MQRPSMHSIDCRRINVVLHSKISRVYIYVISLVICTLSTANWQQASKLTTLPNAVSSFLMKHRAIQKLSICYLHDQYTQWRWIGRSATQKFWQKYYSSLFYCHYAAKFFPHFVFYYLFVHLSLCLQHMLKICTLFCLVDIKKRSFSTSCVFWFVFLNAIALAVQPLFSDFWGRRRKPFFLINWLL